MGIRIKDVAKAANVSTATVSRAISGKPGVGVETTEKIKKIIAEMGYRPNMSARGLASQQTHNIGIVSPREGNTVLGNPFFTRIFEGISNVLDKNQYNMISSFTYQHQQYLVENHVVDGILLFAVREDDSLLVQLRESRIPTIIVGSYEEEDFPNVCPDDSGGIASAVQYLVSKGHKEIELVNGPKTAFKSRLCLEGYEQAMKAHSLDPHSIIEVPEYDSVASYNHFIQRINDASNLPTAIVCSSDYLAFGVMKAANEHGIRIPEDLSIIGFGDVPFSSFTNPTLTTMHTNLLKLGTTSAQMLISKINGSNLRKKKRLFQMDLVERQSVKELK
ncbi:MULTISPECIES: LacI family DNA-binding transcriptional regulator [Shouchella]|uniref:LacI family DNA-binding transcriptional regulator n=2 Tax=Shouchella TaxID=2893057 RepID=A0ABY7W8N4_9BACI|nr:MULTISPECIES: LacI family DNA-binding transcriptional regulator [Shouchella]MED4128366.1 LacI family DNA-binding transcriptional regulator [Shouchella miscanthi]WDF05001.1 LacI family DNA-binding transcriptional regulator [Shouchella hunanensis]GAF21167.1 transcriptional regulator [Bacillus sp. JCM 19047]